jgi:hypothetical protein
MSNNQPKKIWNLKQLYYFLLISVFFWVFYYHITLITTPIQQEYREGAQIVITNSFINGAIPYSFDSLPLNTNPYGFLYQAVCYYFGLVFGSSFLIHRLISGFFILISLAIIFLIIRKAGVSQVVATSATALMYVSFLYGSTPLARPDALGEVLFLAAVLIPYFRKFDYVSLIISVCLLFFILLTKLYFVTAFFIVFLYLLFFVSKKKAFIYGVLFSLIFTSWLIFVFFLFDTYLNQVIGSMAKATALSNSVLRMQLNFYLVSYLIIFLSATFIIVKRVRLSKFFKLKMRMDNKQSFFNLKDFDNPLLQINISYINFCLIITLSLLCLLWGRSDGGWMGYFYQLLSPFLIIRMAIFYEENIGISGAYLFLLNAGLFFLIYFTSTQSLVDTKNWEQIWSLIDKHENIYGSAAVSGSLSQHNKQVYDTGLTLGSWASIFNPHGLGRIFLNKNNSIQNKNEVYCNQILSQLHFKKFDLIMMYGASVAFKENELKDYGYKLITTIPISFPHNFQNYTLSIWSPTEDLPKMNLESYAKCSIYQ